MRYPADEVPPMFYLMWLDIPICHVVCMCLLVRGHSDGAHTGDGVSRFAYSSVLEIGWSVTYPDTSASTPTLRLHSPWVLVWKSGTPYLASQEYLLKSLHFGQMSSVRVSEECNQPNHDEEVCQVISSVARRV